MKSLSSSNHQLSLASRISLAFHLPEQPTEKLRADAALLCYKGIEVEALGASSAPPHIGINMVKPG